MSGAEIRQYLITFIIALVFWLIPRQWASGFFVRVRPAVRRYAYLAVAAIFTVLYLPIFVLLPFMVHSFSLAWAIILALVVWSLAGVWLPVLARQQWWTSRLNNIFFALSFVLAAFVLVGFWIVSYPELLTPFILTCFVGVFIISWLVTRIYEDSRRARSQRR